MKCVMMATSSNFGNILSRAVATLVLPFLPLLPVQILLNNLLYDIRSRWSPSGWRCRSRRWERSWAS